VKDELRLASFCRQT